MTREEAIDVLKCNYPSSCFEELCKAVDIAIKALSAQPEMRWIPCSERLPEGEQEILFSTKTGRVHSGRYHDDNSANQWYSHRDRCRAWNNVVIAWMPPRSRIRGKRDDEKPDVVCRGDGDA